MYKTTINGENKTHFTLQQAMYHIYEVVKRNTVGEADYLATITFPQGEVMMYHGRDLWTLGHADNA